MRDCQQLRKTAVRDIVSSIEEGSIQDVMNVIRIGAEVGGDLFNGNQHNTGSIMKRASDLVLVFPVLVSTSLKIETAVLVSKAIEKKCVNMLQILFSATDLTRYRDTKDLYDYISKFHKNLNTNSRNISLDDFINVMDAMVNANEVTITDKEAYDMVMREMREINSVANDMLRESSVNNFVVTKTMYGRTNVTLEAGPTPNQKDQAKYPNAKDQADFIKSQIVSSDITKANELTPTVMMVNFVTMIDGAPVNRTGVVGVKAKMYPVDHMEIVGRLSSKYSESNTLFNLIRCSTKEKSFFKDFAFAIEKTKLDAVNIAKGSVNSKLFKTLERRASANNTRLLKSGDASPITTLVISQEEVEYLKKYCNMDMENINTAKVIFNGYNLMGVVVVDDSIEVAKFLFDDGEGMFETITYDSLAKEDKNSDYKKIVNLMAKMNR